MLQKQGRLTFLCKFSKQIIIPDTVYNAFIVGINLPIQRSIIKPQPLSIEHHSDNELFKKNVYDLAGLDISFIPTVAKGKWGILNWSCVSNLPQKHLGAKSLVCKSTL